MKYVNLIFLILPLVVYSQKRYNVNDVNSEPYDDYRYDEDWYEITGIIYQEYEFGQLRYEHEYKDGIQDGLSKGWYANGKLKYIENYKDGYLNGWVKYWPLDHTDSSNVLYIEGEPEEGVLKKWYRHRVLTNETHYKEGLVIGAQKLWNKAGELIYLCNYNKGVKKGEEIKWNDEGEKIFRAFYKDGKLDKKFQKWSSDRKEYCEVKYKNGVPWDGVLKDWFSDGQLRIAEEYVEGLLEGKCVSYFPDGQLKYELNYLNGKKHGLNKGYFGMAEIGIFYFDIDRPDNGHLDYDGIELAFDEPFPDKQYLNDLYLEEESFDVGIEIALENQEYQNFNMIECQYKNGELDGLMREWNNDNDLIREENYKNGKIDGWQKFWYKTGNKKQEIFFKEGVKSGESRFWLEDGQLNNIENYKDGVLDGLCIKKSSIGTRVIEKIEINYRKGKKEGAFKQYVMGENDLLYLSQEGNYSNNQKIGAWKSWYANGKPSFEGNYGNNEQLDSCQLWYENDQLKYEVKKYLLPFPVNKERIVAKHFLEDGQIHFELEYEDGKLVHEKQWWYNGQLKVLRNYKEQRIVTEEYWTIGGEVKKDDHELNLQIHPSTLHQWYKKNIK